MGSSKEYLEYILEQLSDLEDITHRAMMGEYILYYRGKIFGGVYDDRFLIKRSFPLQEKEKNNILTGYSISFNASTISKSLILSENNRLTPMDIVNVITAHNKTFPQVRVGT